MKYRLFILVVVAAVVSAAVSLAIHHRQRAIVSLTIKPGQAVPSRIIFPNPVRMVPIVMPSTPAAFLNPGQNAWSEVQTITNAAISWEARRDAIRRLPAQLLNADWSMLSDFLLKPDPIDGQQAGQVIKNELMDKLCEMNPPPHDFGNILSQIYHNLLQNEVIRDYAVQHLATLDESLAQSNEPDGVSEEETAQWVLWNALGETDDSIAGTALLGLARLSGQQNTGIDQNRVASVAMQLSADNAVGELTRITAYQVCAEFNVQTALPTIEAAAQNSPTVATQISAIGALGLLGGANDVPLLQSLLRGNDGRLKLPAQTALRNIETRIHAGRSQSG